MPRQPAPTTCTRIVETTPGAGTNEDGDGGVSAFGRPSIREAGVEDAAVVHTLLLELAEHEGTARAVRSTVEDWRRMLQHPAVLVLLASIGGEPVGYLSGVRQLNLWVGDDTFAMDDLYVRAGARDHGVGGRLMAALAAHAAPERLVITWGAREDNHAGHRFYRRIGASLHHKVAASWSPSQYLAHLASRR